MSLNQHNRLPDEKMKKPSDNRRDLMVHIAVTIMNTRDNIQIIGEKENEITQLAVHIPYKHSPLTAKQAKAMFEKLSKQAFDKMISYGLVRL